MSNNISPVTVELVVVESLTIAFYGGSTPTYDELFFVFVFSKSGFINETMNN